jgi:hypothetical protein
MACPASSSEAEKAGELVLGGCIPTMQNAECTQCGGRWIEEVRT